MDYKGIDFPVYRRLSNQKGFYKIIGPNEFDEIQLMGSKAFFHNTVSEKYPELLRINDMVQSEQPFEESSQEEFEGLLDRYALR